MNIEQLTEAALKLDLKDRADLAGKLLLSLDEPEDARIEQSWIMEVQRRCKEIQEGKVVPIPAEEVFRHVISAIS